MLIVRLVIVAVASIAENGVNCMRNLELFNSFFLRVSIMEFWVVVTIYQGIFDNVQPFKTELDAVAFADKVKADYADEDIQAIPKRIEI